MAPQTTDRAARPSSAEPLVAGTILGDVYRIQNLLGRGAMGSVYLAEHVELGKEFAIKVVGRRGDAPSEDAVQRLIREAQTASGVENDHIVNVTHLGRTEDGLPFVVMERLRGESLRELLRRTQRDGHTMDDGLVRRIVPQILDGLAAAHEAGIVHRDLKPDNIFLHDKRGNGSEIVVKIVDFGMSKVALGGDAVRLTQTGQIVGTPLYMSPEQGKNAADVDERSDLYAFGVIVYEMLCGRVPFEAETIHECLFKHISETPPPLAKKRPDLPPAVAACVHRSLEKDPDERPQSALELLDEWHAAWADDAPAATPAAPAEAVVASASRSRRSSWIAAAIGAAFLLALGGVVLATGAEPSDSARPVEPPVPAEPPSPEPTPEHAETPPTALEPAEMQVVGPALPARTVRVVSRPPGAAIYVDDQRVGAAPAEVTVPEGTESLDLELRRPGYADRSVRIRRDGPDEIAETLVRLRPAPSSPPAAAPATVPELAPR